MSAYLESGKVLRSDGTVSEYVRAVLEVAGSDGPHVGRLLAHQTRTRGPWTVYGGRTDCDSSHGCGVEDCGWSPWAEVVFLARDGVLTSKAYGPGTYGHTDYVLAVEPRPSQWPRRAADGRGAEWACCVSTIGPVCNHKAEPVEREA